MTWLFRHPVKQTMSINLKLTQQFDSSTSAHVKARLRGRFRVTSHAIYYDIRVRVKRISILLMVKFLESSLSDLGRDPTMAGYVHFCLRGCMSDGFGLYTDT